MSDVRLALDPDSPEPPYAQLRESVRRRVASGELAPGTRLPPVRALATELGLAANTVARAGSFVSGDAVGRAAREAAREYADRVRALGIGPDEAVDLVRRAVED